VSDSKEMYLQLEQEAESRGVKVLLVPQSTLKDCVGMNWLVAKPLGIPCPENHVQISDSMSWKARLHTLRHELEEIEHMLGGDKYWTAHNKALKIEHKYVAVVRSRRCGRRIKSLTVNVIK
jgi:hypothetical protein